MNTYIIIASASKTSRLILAYGLRRAGISSVSFSDSTSLCLALLQDQLFTLPKGVILDQDFPQGQPNTFEVVRLFRKRWPQLPIVLCIHHKDIFTRLKARKNGVAYVTKPYQIAMIQKTISHYGVYFDSDTARTGDWNEWKRLVAQSSGSH